MTDTTTNAGYRFPPAHQSGWLLGLTGPQCLLLAGGAVAAGLLHNTRAPWPISTAAFVAAVVLAFLPVGDDPVHTAVAVRTGWTARRRHRRWFRPLHPHVPDGAAPVVWPPTFAGVELRPMASTAWPGRTIGAVHDRRARTLSATLSAAGAGFSLADRDDQQRLLAAWGDVLGGFASEHSSVTAITVTEWAAPAPAATTPPDADDQVTAAVDAYRQLLTTAAPAATEHQTLLTVTVQAGPNPAAAAEGLGEQLRLLAVRLCNAGLRTPGPLDDRDLAVAIRRRLDPTTTTALATSDIREMGEAAPMGWDAGWRHVRVDGSVHAGFWVAGWPQTEVGPAWLEPLLLHTGGPRLVALHLEPIPPRVSHRQIARDATRLASDEAQRVRGGWRIGIGHHRAADAVADREAELAAGHAELAYAAVVVISAADSEELARSCVDYQQVAAQAGLVLRRLDGRHDLALTAALPVGRSILSRQRA